jgi:hypothetical protein
VACNFFNRRGLQAKADSKGVSPPTSPVYGARIYKGVEAGSAKWNATDEIDREVVLLLLSRKLSNTASGCVRRAERYRCEKVLAKILTHLGGICGERLFDLARGKGFTVGEAGGEEHFEMDVPISDVIYCHRGEQGSCFRGQRSANCLLNVVW